MTKFRSIILILAALTIGAALPACAWNAGDPISSVEDLESFRDAVNNGTNFAGKTVILSANINLQSVEWTPIGTDANPFSGKFNGCNHTISGLNVTTATMQPLTVAGVKGAGGGLFLNVSGEGAQIANLKVRGTVEYSSTAASCAAAGIAARLGPGAVIYECMNEVSVALGGEGAGRESYSYAGGVVGYSEGYIIYCVNSGGIKSSTQRTYTNVGGIAGTQHGGSILFSDNRGEVTIPDNGGYNPAYAGGIAGSVVDGALSAVRNEGAVTSYNLAGGITAYAMNSVLRDAVNTTAVEARRNGGYIVTAGGITAQLYNGSSAVNCYNTGKITAGGDVDTAYAGGIAGWSNAGFYASNTIYNCTNSGNISGNAKGSARVGGLVGEIDKTELYASVNSGSVSANSPHIAGGIAGYKYPTAAIHDAAYSGELPPVGFGDRNVTHVQQLTAGEVDSFVATSFPSLTPTIVKVKSDGNGTVTVLLNTHPGTPQNKSEYYSINSVYTNPVNVAAAQASDGGVSVTGMEPGVSLLAVYVETYRSGLDGGIDRTTPSRSLVSAIVSVSDGESSSGGEDVPPLWPDGATVPSVPGEPDTDKSWDERYPRHSCGGGCNSGWGALALLAFAPLMLRKKK